MQFLFDLALGVLLFVGVMVVLFIPCAVVGYAAWALRSLFGRSSESR